MKHDQDGIPEEDFDPEIARQLTIPRMVIPKFEAQIKEDDVKGISQRDHKLVFAMSKIEQYLDFALHWQRLNNYHQRQLQAEQIRQRTDHQKQRDEQNRMKWQWNIVHWVSVTVAASVLAAWIRTFFK
jgi:hypothetical protein